MWNHFSVFLILGVCLAQEIPPNVDELAPVKLFKEKCAAKGKPENYEKLKASQNETKTCIQNLIDPEQVKNELEEAKKTGSMDEVFTKYCNKRSDIKECVAKTINTVKECLNETEITAMDSVEKIIDEIGDFVCDKNGDRLAMFVAEGGVKCITSRIVKIKDCVSSTLNINLDHVKDITAAPSFTLDKSKCDKLASLQQCIVTDLESNCEDTTPANIIEALMKFVKKRVCKNVKKQKRSLSFHPLKMFNFSVLGEKFAKQCTQNGGEIADRKFWTDILSTETCSKDVTIFVTSKEDFLANIDRCTTNSIPKAENCLPDNLKFYPSFILDLMKSLTGFAYDHLNMRKLTPKNDIVFCLQRLKSVGGNEKFTRDCLSELINKASNNGQNLPDQSEVCKLISNIDKCINNIVRSACAPDIAVDVLLGNLTEAVQKPCQDSVVVS